MTQVENMLDLRIATELSLLSLDEGKGRPKLFYLSKNRIGEEDSPEARKLLADIIDGLTNAGNASTAFLLLGEAVKSLDEEHPCVWAWHKILQLEMNVYCASSSCELFEIDPPERVLCVSEAEIAELLLKYEVVTLC